MLKDDQEFNWSIWFNIRLLLPNRIESNIKNFNLALTEFCDNGGNFLRDDSDMTPEEVGNR